KNSKLCCDKCDGKHLTEDCPCQSPLLQEPGGASRCPEELLQENWRKLQPAWYVLLSSYMYMHIILSVCVMPSGAILPSATIIRQPGDGSCLFHSQSYGLRDGSTASSLR